MRRATQDKYDLFCREYMSNGLNGAQAAIAAGYSKNSARQTGKELLDKPYVSDKIRQMQEEITEKSKEKFSVSIEQRLEWLQTAVMYGFREIPVSAQDKDSGTKAENLSASISAIKELNVMLGINDNGGGGATLADAINNLASSLPS